MRAPRLVTAVLVVLLGSTMAATPAHADEATKDLQRRLAAKGCAPGPVDGAFGTWTRAAVIRFQAANGLAQTGAANATTRTRLAAASSRQCNRRPVPGSTGSGRRMVISQGQNYVWLVRADGSVRAQGGVIDNPGELGRGTYSTGSKCGRAGKIRDNSDASGTLRLHNFVRFAPCGIGFHQVPIRKSSGAQIHSNHLLGTNLRTSHGCIRVSRTLSDSIWAFGSPGTRVVVAR